jgi:hypothetical protein
MAAKPTEVVAVKVRMKEKLRRELQVEANRDDISVNAVIERRLNRTLIDDKIMDIIAKTASETSKQFAAAIIDHVHNLMRDTAVEIDRINRTLNLHEAVLTAKKGESNG